jgi:predicted permease
MSLLARLRSFKRSLLHRNQREQELADELAFHLEARAADLQREGLSTTEAIRRARLEFGTLETHKGNIRASLGLRLFDELYADLRYALRMLRRSPGFTAVAIGSLALGIGANTIIFSLAKNALLDRLSVPQPQQLRILTLFNSGKSPIHSFWGSFFTVKGISQTTSFSYPVYQLLRQQNLEHPVLQDLFAFKRLGAGGFTFRINGETEMVSGQIVSGNYYQQLGVRPSLGRSLQPTDDGGPDAAPVITISDGLWKRAFGRSPDVIGKTVQLNFIPVTIVGVNPPGFTGAASVQNAPDVFFTFAMQPLLLPHQPKASILQNKEFWWVQVMGRAKGGVAPEAVDAALKVWLDQDIRATLPVKQGDTMPTVLAKDGSQGMAESVHTFKDPMIVLLSLTGLVLLLACANMANLLLARSSARQREIAVRMALGASRTRVIRQLLTESLLLSCLGGSAGFVLGYLGRNVIPHIYSSPWRPPSLHSDFDHRLFLFALIVSVGTGLLFGLAPAFQLTRQDVNTGLKDASGSTTRRRKGLAGSGLITLQVALSLLLVVGAGLFSRTLINLNRNHLGFDPQGILLFNLQSPTSHYPGEKAIALYQRMEARLRLVPGVSAVTLSENPVLAHSSSTVNFQPAEQEKRDEKNDGIHENVVGESFFDTYRIPLLYGRSFASTDTTSSPPVAVINQALARRFYPNLNPVGKTFHNPEKDAPVIHIVGVVSDALYEELQGAPPPTFYLYYPQMKFQDQMTFVVKTSRRPEDLFPVIRRAVAEVDRNLPLLDVRTQQEQINDSIAQERLFALLTVSFGILALILACIGIYGVMAYNVARRVNEIGIRIALGARPHEVRNMILWENSWMSLIGIAVGLGSAFWLARFVRSMLYGLQPTDPAIFVGAALLLLFVSFASAYGPARRAVRIDPMEALRQE